MTLPRLQLVLTLQSLRTEVCLVQILLQLGSAVAPILSSEQELLTDLFYFYLPLLHTIMIFQTVLCAEKVFGPNTLLQYLKYRPHVTAQTLRRTDKSCCAEHSHRMVRDRAEMGPEDSTNTKKSQGIK